MQHSQVSPNARQQLAETVVLNKARLGLSWQDLADGTGLAPDLRHRRPARPACPARGGGAQGRRPTRPGRRRGAPAASIPLRGSIPGGIPSDPTIYRFYEMLQVYGSTLKALVHEQFGDGIISAINFKLDIKKVEDPEGGSRAVITLDGKYLPTKPF
ncbi:cyanase [Pseudomonas aeruginosa]